MPKCKNNPSRHYKGTEPSPKGNGWCASGESIGKKRKGTDGKMWIVKKTKSSRRWVHCVSCKSVHKKSRKRKHHEKRNTKILTPNKTLKPNISQTLRPGYKLQIRIRMPLQYYIDDGKRLVEAPKKTKLTDARILKYLRSAKFRQSVTLELSNLGFGYPLEVIQPKYTPKVDSIHVVVDTHRVFLVTINATLTDKPSETLQNDGFTMVPFTFKQYERAIKDSFMWWHKGDILPFKQMSNDPDFLDLHYQASDIWVDSI